MKATGQNRIFVAFIVICDGTMTDAYAYGNSVWVDLLVMKRIWDIEPSPSHFIDKIGRA